MLEVKEIKLLSEIGFMAASSGDGRRAARIFEGLMVVRPNRNFTYIGLGLAYMNIGRHAEAMAALDKGLTMVPQQDQAEIHAFRSLALLLAGRQAESREVAKIAQDTEMGRALAGEAMAGAGFASLS